MHSSMLLGAIMAIGCAAAPLAAVDVVNVWDVVTVTLQPGQTAPTAPAAASNNGGDFQESKPKPAPAPAPAPSAAPAPAPSTSDSAQSDSMLSVINYWRQAYNLNTLTWNEGLANNVNQVGQDNHGVTENHELIAGGPAMGQVISPGASPSSPSVSGYSPFGLVYLAWLCEVATDPELQAGDACGIMQDALHMVYPGGMRDHHDILTSSEYNSIFCGFAANPDANSGDTYQGIYTCDLAA